MFYLEDDEVANGIHPHHKVVNKKMKENIQDFVKLKLAAHEYPRIIEFVNDLPMTTTGKIIRKTLRDEIKK